jgi:hypothetical protein
MRYAQLATLVSVVAVLSACGGGSSNSSGSGTPTTSSTLVAQLSHAKVAIKGKLVTATVDAKYGGKAGHDFVLRMGLVDAVSGLRASQGERVIARVTTTPDVVSKTFSTTFNPGTPTDYIVHWALSTPKGVFVTGADSDVFTYKG